MPLVLEECVTDEEAETREALQPHRDGADRRNGTSKTPPRRKPGKATPGEIYAFQSFSP